MESLLGQWQLEPALSSAALARKHLTKLFAEQALAIPADDFLLAATELITNLCRYPEPKPSQITLALKQSAQ